MRSPIVLVPACTRQFGDHPYYAAQIKYVDAVVRGAGCAPLILPALGAALDLEAMLALCDGIRQRRLAHTFECETRLDALDDELITEMHRAGLRAMVVVMVTTSVRSATILLRRSPRASAFLRP